MTQDLEDQRDTELGALRAEIARAVRGLCPPAIAAQADDLAHEILIRLIEKGEGNPAENSSYWRRAAYHAVIDEIRLRQRRREDPLADPGLHAELASQRAANPERMAASSELGAAIGECVKRLGASRRLPTVLFLQGYSVPESAAALGWAGKRVESGLRRGLNDLRACLMKKGWGR